MYSFITLDLELPLCHELSVESISTLGSCSYFRIGNVAVVAIKSMAALRVKFSLHPPFNASTRLTASSTA